MKDEYIDVAPSRRSSTPRYLSIFLGNCFSCNNFGHKAKDCKAYEGDAQANGGVHWNYNFECYKCHNYGHMTRKCRSMMNHNVERYTCHSYGQMERDCNNNMARSPRQKVTKVCIRKSENFQG